MPSLSSQSESEVENATDNDATEVEEDPPQPVAELANGRRGRVQAKFPKTGGKAAKSTKKNPANESNSDQSEPEVSDDGKKKVGPASKTRRNNGVDKNANRTIDNVQSDEDDSDVPAPPPKPQLLRVNKKYQQSEAKGTKRKNQKQDHPDVERHGKGQTANGDDEEIVEEEEVEEEAEEQEVEEEPIARKTRRVAKAAPKSKKPEPKTQKQGKKMQNAETEVEKPAPKAQKDAKPTREKLARTAKMNTKENSVQETDKTIKKNTKTTKAKKVPAIKLPSKKVTKTKASAKQSNDESGKNDIASVQPSTSKGIGNGTAVELDPKKQTTADLLLSVIRVLHERHGHGTIIAVEKYLSQEQNMLIDKQLHARISVALKKLFEDGVVRAKNSKAKFSVSVKFVLNTKKRILSAGKRKSIKMAAKKKNQQTAANEAAEKNNSGARSKKQLPEKSQTKPQKNTANETEPEMESDEENGNNESETEYSGDDDDDE